MNSDLQTQTSQEQAELGLNLGQHQQDYHGHHLHSQPGYTSQVRGDHITTGFGRHLRAGWT